MYTIRLVCESMAVQIDAAISTIKATIIMYVHFFCKNDVLFKLYRIFLPKSVTYAVRIVFTVA